MRPERLPAIAVAGRNPIGSHAGHRAAFVPSPAPVGRALRASRSRPIPAARRGRLAAPPGRMGAGRRDAVGRVRRTRRAKEHVRGIVHGNTCRHPCAFPRPFLHPARSANAPYQRFGVFEGTQDLGGKICESPSGQAVPAPSRRLAGDGSPHRHGAVLTSKKPPGMPTAFGKTIRSPVRPRGRSPFRGRPRGRRRRMSYPGREPPTAAAGRTSGRPAATSR